MKTPAEFYLDYQKTLKSLHYNADTQTFLFDHTVQMDASEKAALITLGFFNASGFPLALQESNINETLVTQLANNTENQGIIYAALLNFFTKYPGPHNKDKFLATGYQKLETWLTIGAEFSYIIGAFAFLLPQAGITQPIDLPLHKKYQEKIIPENNIENIFKNLQNSDLIEFFFTNTWVGRILVYSSYNDQTSQVKTEHQERGSVMALSEANLNQISFEETNKRTFYAQGLPANSKAGKIQPFGWESDQMDRWFLNPLESQPSRPKPNVHTEPQFYSEHIHFSSPFEFPSASQSYASKGSHPEPGVRTSHAPKTKSGGFIQSCKNLLHRIISFCKALLNSFCNKLGISIGKPSTPPGISSYTPSQARKSSTETINQKNDLPKL